jgi:hypothetical protein
MSKDITFDPATGHMVFPDPGRWIEHDVPAPIVAPEVKEEPPAKVGANVVDGVAHFLRITPDPGEPDLCGGCHGEWDQCPHRVRVAATELPRPVDPEEERLARIALNAVRTAQGLPPEG